MTCNFCGEDSSHVPIFIKPKSVVFDNKRHWFPDAGESICLVCFEQETNDFVMQELRRQKQFHITDAKSDKRVSDMAGKEMTAGDFKDLCAYIDKHHSFVRLDGKAIKYVTPTIDMRNGKVFCVKLKGLGGEKAFSIVNENKDKDLKAWIIDWLDNGSWGD